MRGEIDWRSTVCADARRIDAEGPGVSGYRHQAQPADGVSAFVGSHPADLAERDLQPGQPVAVMPRLDDLAVVEMRGDRSACGARLACGRNRDHRGLAGEGRLAVPPPYDQERCIQNPNIFMDLPVGAAPSSGPVFVPVAVQRVITTSPSLTIVSAGIFRSGNAVRYSPSSSL